MVKKARKSLNQAPSKPMILKQNLCKLLQAIYRLSMQRAILNLLIVNLLATAFLGWQLASEQGEAGEVSSALPEIESDPNVS